MILENRNLEVAARQLWLSSHAKKRVKTCVAQGSRATIPVCQSIAGLSATPPLRSRGLTIGTCCCYVFVIRHSFTVHQLSYSSISTRYSRLLDSDVSDCYTMQAKLPAIARRSQ
jgi:hypothetical protein